MLCTFQCRSVKHKPQAQKYEDIPCHNIIAVDTEQSPIIDPRADIDQGPEK